jgi:DNA-binding MarR family transcriptional regulator
MRKKTAEDRGSHLRGSGQIGFLLAQIGVHASSQFAEKIKPLGISPPHAGLLRLLAQSAGLSQKALCTKLSILPSRLVVLLDELEEKGLVERRDDPSDRRSYALYLTDKGQRTMEALGEIARAHGSDMSKGLSQAERKTLIELLEKVVEAQGLTPGVHPGYKRLGKRKP